MLEGIATSDWHLCGLQKHFVDHVDRQFHELDKIYQYAIQNGVQHIFVPGDISDTPHMPYDVYVTLVLFLKKYDGLLNTYYIAGNHDFSDIHKTSMDLLHVLVEEGLFKSTKLYLKPTKTVIDSVRVNLLSYPCIEAPKSKKPSLNFSHIEYNGAIGDNGRKMRVKDEFIQNPGDYNVSGHIHTYQHIESKRAVYCGNPYQKNFGEALPKGFIHFKAKQAEEELIFKHKYVNNKVDFQLLNIEINNREDFKQLSTSDSYRYKLWVNPEVDIPKDLLLRYPNITGGIFDLSTKSAHKEVCDEEGEQLPQKAPTDTKKLLSKFLESSGHSKKEIKSAFSMVREAANHLGFEVI